MLTKVKLGGVLGRKFGREFAFDVYSPAEAVKALCVTVPGFERYMYDAAGRGIHFACFNGKVNISEPELHLPVKPEIRIMPVPVGAKNGGLTQIIIGAVIIVAAYYTGGASTAASGTGAGTAAVPAAGSTISFSSIAMSIGVSMVLGGVTQLITGQQKGLSTADSPDNGASYNFNGPVNTTAQGNPVPLLYGELYVGSAVASAGIYAEDQQ